MDNKNLYINLDNHIDLTGFDNLHYKICRGFSRARHLANIGNLDVGTENVINDTSYTHLCHVYQAYKKYPTESEIKNASKDLDKSELSVFLKFALGGYDLYQTYFVNEIPEYFPETFSWINNLKALRVFSEIKESYFMTLDSGGIPFEHYHPDGGKIVDFIHIRPRMSRPFYIRDINTSEKIYIDARSAWWDDRIPHGGDPVMFPTYTLRIDGVFTDEFRQKILNE